jgi:hypothetical protein
MSSLIERFRDWRETRRVIAIADAEHREWVASQRPPSYRPTPLFCVFMVLVVLLVVGFQAYAGSLVWRECRAQGHSIIHCIGAIS